MKGVKEKCFGLLLLLFTMVGLSLNVSSDVNAYQYDLEYIPFTVPISGNNNGFVLYDALRFQSASNFRMKSDFWYKFTARASSGTCVYDSHNTLDSYTTFGYISNFSIPYTLQPTDNSWSGTFTDDQKCMFEQPSPSFNSSTFPLLQYELFSSYLPYRYPMNAAFLKSSYTDNGFNVNRKFDFSDLFPASDDEIPEIPDVYFNQIDIPLGISTLHFSAGDHVEVKGRFLLDSDDVNNVFTLNPGATLTLRTELLRDYNTYRSTRVTANSPSSVSCTMNSYLNPNQDEARYVWEYSCPFTMTAETNLSGYTLKFRGPNNPSAPGTLDPIFTYDDIFLWIYESSVVVTNNDTSSDPSGSSFQHFEFHGNYLHYAPGYAGTVPEDIIQGDVNYSSSLANLFNFGFFNPFQPLFNLFADDQSCANIPTIASMIHSQDTIVCHFFDSGTRNLLTPVFGLASTMLVFGFAVRWLGASSGNFFDDSGTHDTRHFSLRSRGVIKQ